jgi:hypothetical protein
MVNVTIYITTRERVHVINYLHVKSCFELRTSHVALHVPYSLRQYTVQIVFVQNLLHVQLYGTRTKFITCTII